MQRDLRTILLAMLLPIYWAVGISDAGELLIEKTFTQADGLANDTVLAVFEDSHGTMWFGTTAGVTRYTGTHFHTFTTEDGLAAAIVGLIFEDKQGQLWFGTGLTFLKAGMILGQGISRYDGQKIHIFTTADGLGGKTVRDIFEDDTGTLWFATDGVSRYDGETFHTLWMEGPMGMNVLPEWWNDVRAIAQDANGHFWFGSDAGLSYYNVKTAQCRYFAVDEKLAPFKTMGHQPTGHVTALQFDANENLWISQEQGLCRYDGKTLVRFPHSEALPMNRIVNILRDSRGNLWFTGATQEPVMHETETGLRVEIREEGAGVSVYNGETFQNFSTDDGLPHPHVRSVFEGKDGKLWFATDAGAALGVYVH